MCVKYDHTDRTKLGNRGRGQVSAPVLCFDRGDQMSAITYIHVRTCVYVPTFFNGRSQLMAKFVGSLRAILRLYRHRHVSTEARACLIVRRYGMLERVRHAFVYA